MYIGATTVALYDTLGQQALKYVINQTDLKTIVCANECIPQICQMKIEDAKNEQKL